MKRTEDKAAKPERATSSGATQVSSGKTQTMFGSSVASRRDVAASGKSEVAMSYENIIQV